MRMLRWLKGVPRRWGGVDHHAKSREGVDGKSLERFAGYVHGEEGLGEVTRRFGKRRRPSAGCPCRVFGHMYVGGRPTEKRKFVLPESKEDC